jgi:RHS repeat-associated protein
LGHRIAKRVNGIITEKNLWKDAITLLAVYDANNNPVLRFNYTDARMPVSMTYGGSTYYLAYDQVGSLRWVTDASGTVIKRIEYDSFGNIINDTNPGMNIPFGFAGGLHDRQTGLVRFGVRDYDPAIGRWTAKDPIDFKGGEANLYGYVQNNPVNWVDHRGTNTVAAGIAIGGSLGGPPGAVIGAVTGIIVGAIIGEVIINNWTASEGRLPTGSRPIDQTPWSGDHRDIKDGVGAGPDDKVFISPDGKVWTQNPDGSYEDQGDAGSYTGSGKPSGKSGKDRNKKGCKG